MMIGKEFKATKNTLLIFENVNVSKIPIEVLFLVATFNALPFSIDFITIIIIIFLPYFFKKYVVAFFASFLLRVCRYF